MHKRKSLLIKQKIEKNLNKVLKQILTSFAVAIGLARFSINLNNFSEILHQSNGNGAQAPFTEFLNL